MAFAASDQHGRYENRLQDGELAACLRLEGRVRAERSGCDPLSMFALVAGQGKRNVVQRDTI